MQNPERVSVSIAVKQKKWAPAAVIDQSPEKSAGVAVS